MARIPFTVGTRYLLNGSAFVIRAFQKDDSFLVEDQSFGGQKLVTRQELLAAWAQEKLVFEVHGPHTTALPNMPLPTQYTIPDFSLIENAYLCEVAKRREEIIRPTLGQKMTWQELQAYADKYRQDQKKAHPQEGKGPRLNEAVSRASIARWRKAYIESGYDPRSLVPETDGRGGKGQGRIDPALDTIYQELFQFYRDHPRRRSRKTVRKDLVERIKTKNLKRSSDNQLQEPSWATTRRRIQKAGVSILHARPTRLQAKAVSMVLPGPRPTHILERVEIDHIRLPYLLVDEEDRLPIGCPTVTTALDVYSTFPLGLFVGFEPPSYLAVQNCLYHAILPKEDVQQLYGTQHPWAAFGLFDILVTDQGREFTGSLKDACCQLGIIHEVMPGRTPWYKGHIERFQRTMKDYLWELPGNVSDFAMLFKGHEYDAMKHACVSLSAFWQLLHIFLLDDYAQEWHQGINDTPAARWQAGLAATGGPYLPHSAEEVRILLMRGGKTRLIERQGIAFDTLYYSSPELERLRWDLPKGSRVPFKFNPGDLSEIYVWDRMHEGGKWLVVPAVDQDYTQGMSFWKHKLLRQYVLQKKGFVDNESLHGARKRVGELVEEQFQRTQQSKRGRRNLARLQGKGIQPAPSARKGGATSSADGETQYVVIEASSATNGAQSPPPEKPSSPVGPSTKPRGNGKEKKPKASEAPPPPETPVEWDMTGWSADYSAPHQ